MIYAVRAGGEEDVRKLKWLRWQSRKVEHDVREDVLVKVIQPFIGKVEVMILFRTVNNFMIVDSEGRVIDRFSTVNCGQYIAKNVNPGYLFV